MKATIASLIFAFAALGFTSSDNIIGEQNAGIQHLENDSLEAMVTETKNATKQQMKVSLTFQDNNAEEAMNFYVSLFDSAEIHKVHRWEKDGPGKEGTIMNATFELNGMEFMISDSPIEHNWNFTPGVSIYVDCRTEAEVENLYTQLSEDGEVAMPLNNYGFSEKFAWVVDKYGVSWQLNFQ